MSVEKYTLVGIPTDIPIGDATAEDFVFTGTSEFSHEIESELTEQIVGRRKDWRAGVTEETISVNFPYDRDNKADQGLLDSVKNGKQMRFWIIYNELVTVEGETSTQKHPSTFAYVIPESRSWSVDDESDGIEGSLKVKFNTAEGYEPKLPDELLDPSLASQVVYEEIGESTGDLESADSQNV